ncbi:MAG: hypothetical protein DME33_12285 [Verrucomicrobia bacterium]|nr:MAG: hypothetical protein DME33_12285 [Verrucomicrobiota bacterium]
MDLSAPQTINRHAGEAWRLIADSGFSPVRVKASWGQSSQAKPICQRLARLVVSQDDGAADGTAGLAGHKVRALVRGEAASSASVPARSANNGKGIHNVKIAVGA